MEPADLPMELSEKLLIESNKNCNGLLTPVIQYSARGLRGNLRQQIQDAREKYGLSHSLVISYMDLMMQIFAPICDNRRVRDFVMRYAFDGFQSDPDYGGTIQDDITLITEILAAEGAVTNQYHRNWLYGLLGLCYYSDYAPVDSYPGYRRGMLQDLRDSLFDRSQLVPNTTKETLANEVIIYACHRLAQLKVDNGDANLSIISSQNLYRKNATPNEPRIYHLNNR